MRGSDASFSKRIAVGIVCFLMLAVLLFSAFYVAAEANHDCDGENCPICICIQQCEKILHQAGDGAAYQAVAAVPGIFMLISAVLLAFRYSRETLVSKKVRLND